MKPVAVDFWETKSRPEAMLIGPFDDDILHRLSKYVESQPFTRGGNPDLYIVDCSPRDNRYSNLIENIGLCGRLGNGNFNKKFLLCIDEQKSFSNCFVSVTGCPSLGWILLTSPDEILQQAVIDVSRGIEFRDPNIIVSPIFTR